ncbi:MAG: hypothetical protein ACYC26_10505 [Phycisphaerales bacterium]
MAKTRKLKCFIVTVCFTFDGAGSNYPDIIASRKYAVLALTKEDAEQRVWNVREDIEDGHEKVIETVAAEQAPSANRAWLRFFDGLPNDDDEDNDF